MMIQVRESLNRLEEETNLYIKQLQRINERRTTWNTNFRELEGRIDHVIGLLKNKLSQSFVERNFELETFKTFYPSNFNCIGIKLKDKQVGVKNAKGDTIIQKGGKLTFRINRVGLVNISIEMPTNEIEILESEEHTFKLLEPEDLDVVVMLDSLEQFMKHMLDYESEVRDF